LGRFTLQDYCFPAALWAIKESLRFEKDDLEGFHQFLSENLPYNSRETRRRYTRIIFAQAFPDEHLRPLAAQVWEHYRDDELMRQVAKVVWVERQPPLARFVRERLVHIPLGGAITRDAVDEFLRAEAVGDQKRANRRLRRNLVGLGYCKWESVERKLIGVPRQLIVANATVDPTALFLLIHYRFAKEPCTVEVQPILDDPSWMYLGLRSPDDVRRTLREAAARQLIDRYIAVDRLEQITTRYALSEILTERLRL